MPFASKTANDPSASDHSSIAFNQVELDELFNMVGHFLLADSLVCKLLWCRPLHCGFACGRTFSLFKYCSEKLNVPCHTEQDSGFGAQHNMLFEGVVHIAAL